MRSGPLALLVQRTTALLAEHDRVLVAVDGADGAGKSTLAAQLVALLDGEGVDAHGASLDGFHHPRAHRYRRGRTDPDGYYQDAFDLEAAEQHLLRPWRGGGTWVEAVHDVASDTPLDLTRRAVPGRGVLVVDGVFLLRPELAGWWDLAVRLEAPAPVRLARMAERDGSSTDPDDPANLRYLLAHRRYEARYAPRDLADVVLDSSASPPRLLRG